MLLRKKNIILMSSINIKTKLKHGELIVKWIILEIMVVNG